MTGPSNPAALACIDLFDEGGWPAIWPGLRGRSPGTAHILLQAQEDSIQRTIIDNRHKQLKMDLFLWRRAAVGQLIEQEWGDKLHVRSVGKYLKRRGFTAQRPI